MKKKSKSLSFLLKTTLRVFVSGLIFLTSTGVIVGPSAQAALADCGTAQSPNNSAQNSLTVAPSHGAAFYIDSAASQQMDAQYIAYRISSSANYQSLWVSVDNFSTGSVISLVNPADSPYPIDSIVGGAASPTTVYFLLKATMTSNSPQKHDFKIYQGKPNGQTPLFACTFTFTKVRETIKANPNKVDSVEISNTSPNIGGTFQVSVLGNTGTIGAGSSPDNDSIWLSPVPQSSWPSRAIRLEQVDLLLDNNNTAAGDTCGAGNSCYTNQLVVNNLRNLAISLGNSNTNKLYYLAKYTFRVIGRAPAFTFKPIAQISSGTQMKHSPIISSGAGTATLDLGTVNTSLVISQKSITSPTATNLTTRTINGTSYMGVDYKIVVQNTGATSAKIDGIQDTPDPAVLIDTTTATTLKTFTTLTGGTGTTITPAPTVPNAISGTYTFTTPVTIAASGRAELTYRMLVPQCATGTKTYVNYVVAKIGGTSFGSATAGYAPDATLQFSCGTNQLTTTTSGSGTRIPFDVTTNPASAIGNTTATLNGAVNSYGVSGKVITFEYWSIPTSVSTVTASPGTTTTSTDPLVVSYNATGLSQGTLYYFRVISDGNVGATLTFVTTEPVATPTVVTDPPTGVTSTDATFNGTVDPNQTAVYFGYEVYTTTSGSSASPYEYRIFDDLTTGYNSSTNPYTQYSGSFPVQVPITMNNANLVSIAGPTNSKGLDTLIKANDTVYYRAKITYVSGGTTVTGSWQSFKMTTYLAQTITWNSILDIQWGASAPSLSPTASSGMTVTITLDPSSTGCTYSGGVLTITKVGTCTLLADQSGGLKSGTSSYYNAADQVPITFNILPNEVTVTANAKTKKYGDADPTLDYTTNWTVGSLKSGDNFSGSLTRATGGSVGTYAINQGTLALSSNYKITYVSANLVVDPRPITVTADAKTKVYGNADPALTYVESCVTSPCRIGSDTFTGAISRATGNNVGTYAIGQGTLALNSNYTITYVSANLEITARPITLKADSFSKSYAVSPNPDPTFTYSLTSGSFAYSDSVTAISITRATGESVGDYVITIGAVTISPSTSNYAITKATGTLTITDKIIPTITWNTPAAITYGTPLSSTQLNAVVSNGATTLTFDCVYTPPAGETLTATTHVLSVTCTPKPADASTYGSVTTTVNLVVNPKPITVVADPQTKVYGATDPTFTYTCTTTPTCLVGSDAFTGSLTHTTELDGSEIVKQYDITQGTLALNSNYTITFTSAKFTITAKPITISVTADNKIYDGGTSATVHIGSMSGILDNDLDHVTFGGSITGAFTDKNVANGVTVSLTFTKTLSGTASGNYTLQDPTNPTANITKKTLQITANNVTVAKGASIGSIGYSVNSGDLVGGDTSSVVSGITCTSDYVTTDDVGASRSTTCSGGTASNYNLTFTSGLVTITAATTYTVTIGSSTGGSATADNGSTSTVTSGGSVVLQATASSGYVFSSWTCGTGGSFTTSTDNPATLSSITADLTCTPNFTASSGGGSSGGGSSGGGSSGGGGSPSPAPVITPKVPTISFVAGKEICANGVTLVIEGHNLAGASVTLDGTPVTVASSSETQLLLELPAGGIGTKTLKVFNVDGSAATSIRYVLVDNPVYYNFTYPETYKDSPFTYTFAATNAYGYAIEGKLPAGLWLNETTGEIYGTPTKEGDYLFSLVAINPCGKSYLDVYMLVDKPIPPNYTCNVNFNVPTSNLITPVKVDALKSCLTRILTQGPATIDPVIFLSGGVPLGSSIAQMAANPRYTQIVAIIDSLNIVAQIYIGAFSGPIDQVQVMVYWPVPLDV